MKAGIIAKQLKSDADRQKYFSGNS